MKKQLPLHTMAENFGLVSKSMRPKLGVKSCARPIVRGKENGIQTSFVKRGRPFSEEKKGKRPCQTGTCQGKGDRDGGLVRHTERALRPEASQGPDEADGNPIHLLRHQHGKYGAFGGQDRAESTAGGLLKRKHAHRKVLSQGNCASVIENGQKIRPKRPERDINVNLVT